MIPGPYLKPGGQGKEHSENPIGNSGRKLSHQSRQRLIRGISAQSLAIVVRVVQQVAFVPILIAFWGVELYQDWIVVFSAANLLSMTDLGMQLYFGNRMLSAWSRGDKTEFRRAIGIAIFLYVCILGAVVAALFLTFMSVSLIPYLGIKLLAPSTVAIITIILALSVLSSVPLGLYTAIYRARGDYGLSVGVTVLGESARGIGVCVVVWQGGGAVSASLIYLIVGALIWGFIWDDQRRRYGEFPLSVSCPSYIEARSAIGGSFLYGAHFVANPLISSIPILALNTLSVGQLSVVVFSVSRTLTGLVRQVILQPNLTVGLEMARYISTDNLSAATRLYLKSSRISSIASGLLAGITAILAEGFVKLWTHEAVPYDHTLGIILLLSIVANVPGWSSYNIFQFTNRPGIIALANTVYASLSVLLCIALVNKFSIIGAAAAIGIAEFIGVCLLVSWAACKSMKIPVGRYLGQCIGLGMAAFMLSYWASSGFSLLVGRQDLPGLLFISSLWMVGIAAPSATLWFWLEKSKN